MSTLRALLNQEVGTQGGRFSLVASNGNGSP